MNIKISKMIDGLVALQIEIAILNILVIVAFSFTGCRMRFRILMLLTKNIIFDENIHKIMKIMQIFIHNVNFSSL